MSAGPAGLLSRDRTAVYPWMVAVGLVLAWSVSAAMGPGFTDATGALVGNDFMGFYAAARMVADDPAAPIYDLEQIRQVQLHLVPEMSEENVIPWLNPPPGLLLYRPFAGLSFGGALAVWWALNAGCWLLAQRLLSTLPGLSAFSTSRVALGGLLFAPTLLWFLYGQATGVILLLLVASTVLLVRGREGWAGVVLGLLLFKPNLAVGVALPLLVALRWRALLGGAAVVAAQLGLSAWLWPAQWGAFLEARGEILEMVIRPDYNTWGVQSVYAFWHLLIGGVAPGAADALTAVVSIGGLLGLAAAWRGIEWRPAGRQWRLALAGTLLIALPLGMQLYVYDLGLLLLPAWLVISTLVGVRPGTDPALDGAEVLRWTAGIWTLTFIAPYLSLMTTSLTESLALPRFGIQVLVPVLLLSGVRCWQRALTDPGEETPAAG